MELITSLISSSVKGRASETTMRTQQFITKKTNSSSPNAVLISIPSNRVCVCTCLCVQMHVGGMGFDVTKRKGAQHRSPAHGPGTV